VQRILFVAGVAALILAQSAKGQTGAKASALPSPKPVVAPFAGAAAPPVKPAVIDPAKLDWRFAHPKPDLLLNLNVGRIARSADVAQSLRESFHMTSDADRAKIDMILKMVGSIERVQISLRSTQMKNDPDYLVLVTGNLDPMVRQMLMQPTLGAQAASREVSPNAILIGKAASMDQAVRRMSGAPSSFVAGGLSSSDLWIAGDVGLLQGATNGPLPPGIDSVKRFELGLNSRDPVELNVNLSMLNEDGAEKLLAMYNLFAAQAAQTPDVAAFVNLSKIDRQGSEIHFRFAAPVAMLQSQMRSAVGGAGALSAGGGLPALLGMLGMSSPASPAASPAPAAQPAPVAAPVAPEKPGKIMIYGLDDGPHEVGAPKKNE
jgi:hypothetical protein